ncbi:acyl-CoA dehydrogenase NM domain-like protein [Patellaria atrata CBS 101060]|uniref:Acyl-CoA dehydrogenase NM domain-like protein n=1 Tax=Patellaria atrata CBS 101060 TaxID=1346257 RepID=A0A9P4SFV0_9PEZI|nr:acyl-CoA dehydrogenase NM domain-like protein [Patellaria atrata CBS 101060]
MAPTLLNQDNHPGLARIPPWVLAKCSPKAIETIKKVYDWVENECIPAEPIVKAQVAAKKWRTPPYIKELRKRAKAQGLFNLFLPRTFKESPGLTNLEYACCAEIMGRCYWAPMTMNCHAPETGNIELLAKFCNEAQKKKWLQPLLDGETSSAYSMTEPDVASSDATNINCRITRDGDTLVINGRKLYGNAAWNEDLGFYILMGCSDPENPNPWARHTTVIVPKDTPGLKMVRNLTIMNMDWAPEGHGEYVYENVRIPAENIILGEGRAFEIAQGRLGPGRIHHCMRLLGQSERAYELALIRAIDERKKPRGKRIADFDSNIERIADMRMELDAMRLVTMNAADTMDQFGNKAGRYAIAQSKIMVPLAAAKIIDECMQMFGGQGLTQHTPLPELWTYARFVRVADGPDAAHRHQVGRDQIKTAKGFKERHERYQNRFEELGPKWGVEPEYIRGDPVHLL